MRKDYTDIVVVLDRSGSMESIRLDTIGGFNAFIKEQKKVKGFATVTLIQFDDQYTPVYNRTQVKQVEDLSTETFVPRGSTALYDSLARAINEHGELLKETTENERPEKVVVLVITDGHENASRMTSAIQLKELIKQQTETYGWEFVFIGANQDAMFTGSAMGFSGANTMTYAANTRGVESAYSSLSKNMTNFRAGSKASMSFEDVDKEAQKQAGVV